MLALPSSYALRRGQYRNLETWRWLTSLNVRPEVQRARPIDDLISGLKQGRTSGANMFSRMDDILLLAVPDSQNGLVNLRRPSNFIATLVNSPTFTADQGFAGNGTSSYLETNYNPASANGNFVRDSASFGVWSRTTGTASNGSGWFDGNDGVQILTRSAGNAASYRINSTSVTTTTAAVTDGSGLFVANRSASNATQIYRNGVQLTDTTNPNTTSSAINNASFSLGRVTAALFVATQYSAFFVGGSFSAAEQVDIYNAFQAYMTAVGA